MRTFHAGICLLALLASAGVVARADGPRDHWVVSPTWLAQHLHDSDLVVLYAGDQSEYGAKHIPGARHVALADLSTSDHGLSLEMLPADDLRHRLSDLGISDTSTVVVSYGSLTAATRVIFTLDYAGLSKVSLLDGGLDGWIRAGQPVTTAVAAVKAGTLRPLSLQPTVVDAAFVLAHLKAPHFAVVDARASAFYDGVQTGGNGTQRTGHIAGAVSVPYTSITNPSGEIRSAAELEAIFAKAGVKPDDTIVGYCHIGQQATAMLLAARSLGHPVLLYDGSFEDWSKHPEYPVDNPATKGGGRR